MGKPLLDVIKDLAQDPAEQARFAADPDAYMASQGYDDLPVDDLHQAVDLTADNLPPEMAVALSATSEGPGSDTVTGTLGRLTEVPDMVDPTPFEAPDPVEDLATGFGDADFDNGDHDGAPEPGSFGTDEAGDADTEAETDEAGDADLTDQTGQGGPADASDAADDAHMGFGTGSVEAVDAEVVDEGPDVAGEDTMNEPEALDVVTADDDLPSDDLAESDLGPIGFGDDSTFDEADELDGGEIEGLETSDDIAPDGPPDLDPGAF